MKSFLPRHSKFILFSLLVLIGMFFYLGFIVDDPLENKENPTYEVDDKQRGAHVFGQLDSTNVQPLIQHNFEWITFVPFGDQKDIDSPTMSYRSGDSLRILESNNHWRRQIKIAQDAGFKIFLKPHLWLYEPKDGKWRSDVFPSNDENWELWKESYRDFIFRFAKIAEESNVELFCIGTEFSRLSIEKPLFWKKLIRDVRHIYSGKITYAANWYQEFEAITFWEDLDYIGIQAYFPLVKKEYPSVQEISKAWNKHIPAIEAIHKKYHKKILFTEMGYKSTADSAIEPWKWINYSSDQNGAISTKTQANCYEAFFNTIWKKDWFAGVHIWQWRSDHEAGRGKSNLDFTPQGKPAQEVIAKEFGRE